MKEKLVKANEGVAINVLGDNQLVKLTAEDSNGQLTVIMQHLPAGIEIPAHVHTNEDEHFHLIEGEVQFTLSEKVYNLVAGDMIFLPRNIPHAIKVTGNDAAIVRLSIIPAGLEKMFGELDQLSAGPPDLERVSEICGRYGVTFV